MKLDTVQETLRVSGVSELSAKNSSAFKEEVRAAFPSTLRCIEVDLSETEFLDSSGLGALVSLHKDTATRNGSVTLLSPRPPVHQLLELTRMSRIFEIRKAR